MDYLPHTDEQFHQMLETIGAGSFEDLLTNIPPELRAKALSLAPGLSEPELLEACESLASRNRSLRDGASFLGFGAYHHLIPTALDALASRGEWLTPYTPYQAEASQGTLQAIYEFQTMVCELMQMDVANASLYDGASSLAEAAVMAHRVTERPRLLVSEAIHPNTREVVSTYLGGSPVVVQEIPTTGGVTDLEAVAAALKEDVAALLMQQPNTFGCLEPMRQAGELAHRVGALFIASVYPISLGLLQPPGAYGADVAVAEGRCLGSPIAYGGPGLGLFTTTQQLLRKIPGRLAGCTIDGTGKRGFTLTLQTREQHIRREKATSNICTNEGWLALRATIFLSLLGAEGMRELAEQNLQKAHDVFERFCGLGLFAPAFDQPFFNEFALRLSDGKRLQAINRKLAARGILGGVPLDRWYPHLRDVSVWCVTEVLSRAQIERTVEVLKSV